MGAALQFQGSWAGTSVGWGWHQCRLGLVSVGAGVGWAVDGGWRLLEG